MTVAITAMSPLISAETVIARQDGKNVPQETTIDAYPLGSSAMEVSVETISMFAFHENTGTCIKP